MCFRAAALALCVLLVALNSRPLEAGQAAHALERADAAQQLADGALALLAVGEESFDADEKRRSYTEGLRLARQAVLVDDQNADAHFAVFANHGRLQLLDGAVPNPFTLAKANRELERTLELDPNHADALAAKGGMYRQLPRLLGGSLDKAETLLTRAISLNPNSVGARIELARLYQDRGRAEDGVPLLQAASAVAKRQGKHRQLAEARLLLEKIAPAGSGSAAR
jgi:hypothetical protein